MYNENKIQLDYTNKNSNNKLYKQFSTVCRQVQESPRGSRVQLAPIPAQHPNVIDTEDFLWIALDHFVAPISKAHYLLCLETDHKNRTLFHDFSHREVDIIDIYDLGTEDIPSALCLSNGRSQGIEWSFMAPVFEYV